MTRDLLPHERQVVEAVRGAASEALERGAAELSVTTVKELFGGDAEYDAIAVTLTPGSPAAAALHIEIHAENDWTVSAANGPYMEFSPGIATDSLRQLGALVQAVVAGRYHTDWVKERIRLATRPWRRRTSFGWRATWETELGRASTVHFGYKAPSPDGIRGYPPY